MTTFPSLDAHAHLDPNLSDDELAGSGAFLAMTFSLDRAAQVVNRRKSLIAWGVGCTRCNLSHRKLSKKERWTLENANHSKNANLG